MIWAENILYVLCRIGLLMAGLEALSEVTVVHFNLLFNSGLLNVLCV